MALTLLIGDVAAARSHDLLVEAQQHRLGLGRQHRVIAVMVRATANWAAQIRASRTGPASAAT